MYSMTSMQSTCSQRIAASSKNVAFALQVRSNVRAAVKTCAFFGKSKPSQASGGKGTSKAQLGSVPEKKKSLNVSLGFTKTNELFIGRLAMLGFVSSIAGELLTGKGALAQLGFETGLPLGEIDGIILGVIGFNLIAAALPSKGRFVAEDEEVEGSSTATPAADTAPVSILDFKRFIGFRGFGFTKENEIFVGRMAQLGFLVSLIGEALTGQGILSQFDCETGLPLNETEPLLIVFILFTLFLSFIEGSGRFVDEE